jgi:signal transduction histidine kinase
METSNTTQKNTVPNSAVGNINRESNQEKFRRLEKLREIFVLIFVFVGVIIIQFPLPNPLSKTPIEFNYTGIYITAALIVAFAILWHRLFKFRMREESKFFIETIIYILGIHVIVFFSGGTYSYFTFLYFLPVLNTAANLNLKLAVSASIFTSIVMGTHLYKFVGQDDFINAFSLYFLNLFGVWLVTALGRFLATEVLVILKRQEEFELEQLRQLDKLKDEFVFIIAHELRSPITAIRGYLELISTDESQKMDNNLKSLVQKSFSTSNKLGTIISLLLEVARVETGKIRFYLQKIDLKDSVDFVVAELKREVQEKEIQLTVNVPKENYLMIDKERLEEILHIVIENAIFFTPEYGKILISTQLTEKQVLVSVSDTGVGIPEEMKEKLFDKFYTEDTTSGEIKIKGYGIGLYVAKQLLLRMNGDITFESIAGRGTTFTLHLPKFWAFG